MRNKMEKTSRNKLILIISLFMISLLLTGCQNQSDAVKCDILPILPEEPLPMPQKADCVGIYVDVTPSMKGFLGMATDSYQKLINYETRYMQCLDEVNEIITIMFDEDIISYYRVDTPLWRTRENVLTKAKERQYYFNSSKNKDIYELIDLIENDGEGYESWCITNTLLNCLDDDFSVFITDFYENNRQTAEVISALKSNMTISAIPDGKTIGIIGIKSQYAGTVYDYGEAEVEYGLVDGDVTEDDICYRQFFVIVIGFPEDIQEFCGQLQENMNLGESDIKCTIFYEKEIYGLDYTSLNLCHSRSKDTKNMLWPEGKVVINEESNLFIYGCRNITGDGRDIVLSYNVEGDSLKNELQQGKKVLFSLPDVGEKELREVSYYIKEQKGAAWEKDENSYVEGKDYAGIFQIENIFYSQEEELLYVWFKVYKKELPSLSLKLSCQIHLERSGDIGEGWEDDWNVENNELDFEKTRNLKEYFRTLRKQMPDRNNVLLDFAFYINN